MRDTAATVVGKSVKGLLAFRRRGGQALPGLVVEKMFPDYVGRMLKKLPEGVVIISGTNGKTTTTKMVVHLLRANGKRILTNSTGSNLVRGIASSLSQQAKLSGKLPFDLAVLEVDEAAARALVELVAPRWLLALNVSRDQLDRFGEVDSIAAYLGDAMSATTAGIVANANDPYLYKLAKNQPKASRQINFFGLAPPLKKYFPTDYELAAVDKNIKDSKPAELDVELTDFDEQTAEYRIDGKKYKTRLKLSGQHNFFNGAAAMSLARQLLPEVKAEDLINQLAQVELAFGRGENYQLKSGALVELVLIKNPASFTQALASYGGTKSELMIAINDKIADGRDVSWLWDVNFEPLKQKSIALTSGSRAADMALRLSYEDISVNHIEPELAAAVKRLAGSPGKKVILATYTAMMTLHPMLSKMRVKR